LSHQNGGLNGREKTIDVRIISGAVFVSKVMAKIILSACEIKNILKSNGAPIEFIGYENDMAIFRVISWLPDAVTKMKVRSLLKEHRLEKHVNLDEYPKVGVDIKKMLEDKIKGIQFKDIAFQDGLITIAT
jgi:hypothetical protein